MNNGTVYKEYAVTSDDNRPIKIKRSEKPFFKDHVDVDDGSIINNINSETQCAKDATFAANENANVAQLHTGAKEKATNIRITSGILRRRNCESSIVFGNNEDNNYLLPKRERENAVAFAIQRPSHQQSKEYEDAFKSDNKPAIKARRRRDHSAETHDNIGLILQPIDKSTKYSSGNVYSDKYKDKKYRPIDISKSSDPNVWKKKDLTEETVTQQDYHQKKGERYAMCRPQDSDIIQGDGIFIGETQTKAEFTAKKGERYAIKRPQTSNLWKVPFDEFYESFCNISLLKAEKEVKIRYMARLRYSSLQGDRCATTHIKSSNLGSGYLEDETAIHHDYKRTKDKCHTTTRQHDTDIFSGNKTFLSKTYIRPEFTAKTSERYDVKRPVDSELWKGDELHISQINRSTENTAKKGERYSTKRPVESGLWKTDGQINGDTVSHQDYSGRSGERYPVSKPQDS
ncbi:unnamed protein product, partial [Onchocerca ochengi]|uniref:Non-specific serine/threonine protein kinase n=1 Tax=Onchocerca ochengi TaxID=42157 RepID=A0A182EFW7_ONCOC